MSDSKTLYLSDLDGTLIRSDECMTEYTATAVNRFVARGGHFSYATARSIVSASKVTSGLMLNFPVICYNGAFILKSDTRKILSSIFFSREEAKRIRQALSDCKVLPIVYAYVDGVERFSFMERDISEGMEFFLSSRARDPRRRVVQSEDELYAGDIFYFSCISDENELAPIHAAFRSDGSVYCIYHKDIYSGAQWCELMPAKATKANAALKLKLMLGLDRLVVFGDGLNDLSLFSVADECYAVENAVPELKQIATAVIGCNEEDGVAKWLEKNAF